MPKSKLTSPCSIHNCDKNSNNFRCLSDRAIEKATTKGNLQRYPYLQQVLYNKRHDSPIFDPDEFNKMLKDNDLNIKGFFNEVCNILIPEDCSEYNKKKDRKKVVTILYLMAGIQNKHANNFKLELALYLIGSGTFCDGIDALGNAGVSKIAEEHPLRVKKYFNENKNNLCIYNLDDYHNIHEKRHPNHTTLSEADHLATSISKKIEGSMPVPIMFNNASVHNPDNIDPSLISQWINNTGQFTFDRIDQLTIHCYDNAIAERKEEHKMKGTILIGVSEQQLHSMQDYLKALNMILNYNKEIGHLNENVAPVVADWPGQLFICKAITHLHNSNISSIIQLEVVSFVPIIGPLHVSLNTREQIIK
ncbi:12181_t:CDS:2 [Entrophospora sp. SA101]|nr:12181_t:CDS:2 [Entrophospora sp. SA101]